MYKRSRIAKYLPFDSLKGLKEKIYECDNDVYKISMPQLSDEQKEEMDYVIIKCYSGNRIINISYYENGDIKSYSGVINKIDFINKKIILYPKKKIDIDLIVNIFSEE